jgi:hypothetical protein
MPFIEKEDKEVMIEDSDWEEKSLVDGFMALLGKRSLYDSEVSCGVNPSPDFGYCELGDRFWRGSLCIYFFGASNHFWERGAGYPEPWLFNARHSIELYLKGFSLFAFWFKELQENSLSSGLRKQIENLGALIKNFHGLYYLYADYRNSIQNIIGKWSVKGVSETPKLKNLLLSQEGEDLLKEIDEADKTGFRFRYPSLRKDQKDSLQKLSWRYEELQVLPKTGLPQEAGFCFDPRKVINSLHKLMHEMKEIRSYLGGCWDYIGEMQDIVLDLAREYQ